MTDLAVIESDPIGSQITDRTPDFIRMLGSRTEAERFVQEAFAAVNANPFLRQCTPESLFGALYFAAQVGLPVGGPLQQFHLTPRQVWNPRLKAKEWQVVPVIGYNGLITLAKNTGEYDAIEGKLVYSNDEFEAPYDDETGTHFKLRPAKGDRGELIGVIGRALVKGSDRSIIEYLTADEIDRTIRPTGWEKTPWRTHRPQMFQKTGIRRVSKYTAKSRESARFAQAIEADEAVIRVTPTGELEVDHTEAPAEDWAALVAAANDKAQLQVLWQRLVASERPDTIDKYRAEFAARGAQLINDSRPVEDRPTPAEQAAAQYGHELPEDEYERVTAERYAAGGRA